MLLQNLYSISKQPHVDLRAALYTNGIWMGACTLFEETPYQMFCECVVGFIDIQYTEVRESILLATLNS